MIRFLAWLSVAGLAALGVARVLALQGKFELAIDGSRVTTTIGHAAGMALLFAFTSAVVAHFLWLALTASGALGRSLNAFRHNRGHSALSRGLVAAAAGDGPQASRYALKARALLGEQPLSLLLAAQAARLAGDAEAQSNAWTTMLRRNDTAALGLRGLFVQAMRRDDLALAADLVARADALTPKPRWATDALFDLKTRQRCWTEAKALLAEMRDAGIVDTHAARRCEAVLLAAQAFDAARRGDTDATLSCALDAVSLAPELSPAAVLAARVLMQSGQRWRAQDVLAVAWTHNPDPMLAQAFAAIQPNESKEARARRLTELAQLNRDHFESRLVFAEQAVVRGDWSEARRVLAPFAHGQTTSRFCALMAEIEQFQASDVWAAHAWMNFSAHATPDADWRCVRCGGASEEWHAVCANCGGFDLLAWPSPPGQTIDAPRPQSDAGLAGELPHLEARNRPMTVAFAAHESPRFARRKLKTGGARFVAPSLPDDFGPGTFGFDRNSPE
jgi:HemY protein